ncbi:TPA: hypothetical protein N0F65_002985 [Lagenidium giganteum]|uniref:Calponin-homology (CH) domain-containing protein n=1 Tax=Lagenidium giganteum TaxID=4803 RepID=A0AAV2YHT3_9STRA|nr:TPA: hypothetical protein N0F65_002985 [Lagenidium giganteum]
MSSTSGAASTSVRPTSAALRVAAALQVAPTAIEFNSFEPNVCYVSSFTVRNTSSRMLRYRVMPPAHASPFKVLNAQGLDLARTPNPTVTIPPGLSIKYDIALQVPDAQDEGEMPQTASIIHDAFQLKGDDQSRIEVPLLARRAFPNFELDTSLCDLGLIVLTHRAANVVRMKNVGARKGWFDAEVLQSSSTTSSNTVTVTPARGVLQPQQDINLKVEVIGRELGNVRSVVRVRVREMEVGQDHEDALYNEDRACQTERLLDVCGKVVEHNVELVLKNGLEKVKSLYFGSLLSGESKSIETILRNNGPQPLFFQTTLTFGGNAASAGSNANSSSSNNNNSNAGGTTTEEDREAYERRKEMQVTPQEGRIEPFAEIPITFCYRPRQLDALSLLQTLKKIAEAEENWNESSNNHGALNGVPSITLNAFASIMCPELPLAQNLTFEMAGRVFLPRLEVSPPLIDFGDCKSHDRVDMLLSVKNMSGLPIQYRVPKIAQFTVKPSVGRLDVLQSQSLVVSFVPTQLGNFRNVLTITINGGIFEVPVHVQGNAAALGDVRNRALVGGTQALPKDFEPKYKFVLFEDAKQTKGTLTNKFNRIAPFEMAALNGTAAIDEFEFQGTNNTHLTYCVKELAKRAAHNASYHEFLAESRAKREEKKKRATGIKQTVSQARGYMGNNNADEDGGPATNDPNIGMDLQSGVEPRMLRLPPDLRKNPDPLWVNESLMGSGAGKSKMYFDENKFIKRKFKSAPATQAEIVDCSTTLDFDQLEQILCGPKTLHFGKLSVNGIAKKSLTVINNLPHNILVALHLSDQDGLDELAGKTLLKAQVIPPRTTAGFDLVFSSTKEQFFQKSMTYSINGVHMKQVTVVAEVAPIFVQLSSQELMFEFGHGDTSPSMSMELTLTNTSDSVAPFQWELLKPQAYSRPDSSASNGTAGPTPPERPVQVSAAAFTKPVFEIVPSSGSLKPTESLTCQVLFTPMLSMLSPANATSFHVFPVPGGHASRIANEFQLEVTGGKRALVKCKALVYDIKYTVKEKKLDFGTISIGMEKEKRITISNTIDPATSHRIVYSVSIEPVAVANALGISITPSMGSILPQDTTEVLVKICAHRPAVLENVYINLQVRGGKSMKIPVLGSVLIPDVKISQSVLDFADVILGVSVPRLVSLENNSAIPAALTMDLNSTLSPEFCVSMPQKLLARFEDASSIFMPVMDATTSNTESVNPPDNNPDQDMDAVCSKWQICIPANTTVSFNLLFTPTKEGSHEQILPIQFAGLNSKDMAVSRPPQITRKVVARAVAPRLLFSSSVINFHRCVITREGIRKVPYTKQLVLTNADESTLRWQVDTSKLRAAQVNSQQTKRNSSANAVIFHMAPEKGELAPGDEIKIRVSFLPMEAVEYVEEEIPLMVDEQFYINLSVSGVGIHPHLSFSENKILLPTVPLGIPSIAKFFIQSTGYDHLEINHRLPVDLSKAPISLHFPKGKIVSMACPKIPVEVRFLSKKSVAFSARIEFFDADGNIYHLPISGCTENCILTNYDYIQHHLQTDEMVAPHDDDGTQSKKPLTQKCRLFTHPSYKYPVYLLPTKQYDDGMAKLQLNPQSKATEKAKLESDDGTSGVVEIDSSAFVDEPFVLPIPHHLAPVTPIFSDQEIRTMVQFLNANFLRNPIKNFPHDFSDALGKPLYELLDVVCTKKPPSMPSASSLKASSAKGASAPTKKELQVQYVVQYGELLKFLKSYGAMLHDVLPEHLLTQELYIRAGEDPRVDPALFSSPAFLTMKFLQRRHALEKEWRVVSSTAWMKVIYQVVKCFLLYRINWKNYQQQQASAMERTAVPFVIQPRSCQGSNVYSESEMVLLQWICDNVRSKAPPPPADHIVPEASLLDFKKDLQDGRLLFHLLTAHIPTLTADLAEYRCFRWESQPKKPLTAQQLKHNTSTLLTALVSFGVDFGLLEEAFLLEMNAREIILLLLHLYQMLPQFIPKATIEFKGILGQAMEKSIELKNPSNKLIRYQVFLDTGATNTAATSQSTEFTIESSQLTLEPGKVVPFVVTFNPRFSRKVTARLVFQSIREVSVGNSSFGATMVFLLESNIVSRKPVRVIQIEANTYDKKVEEIVIENQFPASASYKLAMIQTLSSIASSGSVMPQPTGPTSTTTNRKRTVQQAGGIKDSVNGPGSASSFGSRKAITQQPRRDEVDSAWCICSQHPFYLPEFGISGSASGNGFSDANGPNGAAVVTIRQQGSASIKLEFLPLQPGSYKCQLLFLDEKIGEFMYEIQALAHLPTSLETLEFQCEANAGSTNRFHFFRELSVPSKNPSLARALASFVERSNGLLKTKLKEGLKKCEENHHTAFCIEFNSPYFVSVHNELTMTTVPKQGNAKAVSNGSSTGSDPGSARAEAPETTPAAGSKPGAGGKANQAKLTTPRGNPGVVVPNTVLIDFQPKGAGVYACKLLLRSHNTVCGSADLRVYDLHAKVKEPNIKTLLDFVAPARHSIVQEIPLANNSDSMWQLRAVFGANGSMFSGPATIQVPPKKHVNYPLTFTPKWISQEKVNLVLINPATQQQFEFELNGCGEEPLAQDHVVLTCQARTSIVHEFDVLSFKTDPPGAQTYKVESDLRDVVGASTVTVPTVGGSVRYPLTFSPLVSGTYFGSITFTNTQNNEYLWYTIEANVSPPEPETTLDMQAAVRSAIGVEISLENPLDHAVTFTIELRGDGLMGPSKFELPAKQTGVYELVYCPVLQLSNQIGAILFSNEEIGQFWYRLNLTADEAQPTELEDMSCAVGDVCAQPIILQNPSDKDLTLQFRITNTRNFSIKGSTESDAKVLLPAFGQASVVVEYTPSSLSEFESSRIVFFSPHVVSDWEFHVKGKGKAPSVMKPIVVSARVSEGASTLFTFKNPFADALTVDVKLLSEEEREKYDALLKKRGPQWQEQHEQGEDGKKRKAGVFDILLKKSRITLESFGHLQVPISFIPQYVSEAHAEIIIRGRDHYAELEWRYPIRGVAEAPLHPRSIVLACQARDSIDRWIACELLAAPPGMSVQKEQFSIEWDITAERFGPLSSVNAIERSLAVSAVPIEPTTNAYDDSPLTPVLLYQIRFDPLRPYRGSIYLIVTKKTGGRWKFDVSLDVSDPPVDDVITIESTLNQTSSISFHLRNQFREPAHFQAEFSAGSSSAFTVYPSAGVLPPYGSAEAVTFVVSFTPTGYGKMQSGQLIILTEEMQWTFNVKGTYPDFASSSKASSLTSSASRQRLGMEGSSPATTNSSTSPSSSNSKKSWRKK